MAKKRKSKGKTAWMKVTRPQVKRLGMDFSDIGCPFEMAQASRKKAGRKK